MAKIERRGFLKIIAGATAAFAAGALGQRPVGAASTDQRPAAAGAQLDGSEVEQVRKLLQPDAYARILAFTYLGEGMANPRVITEKAVEIYSSPDSLVYPALQTPDPARELVFPDVKQGDRPALAAFEQPFSNADYFHAGFGEVDLPQYYFRLITGRTIVIPELGLNVRSEGRKGALVLLLNHYGETAAYRSCVAENCYTEAGRVFDMGTPGKVAQVRQALLDHQVGRMTKSEDGADCSVISACQSVEWHAVIVGNGKAQVHTAGLYSR